ncbi:MAG TPA: hypothetical protein DCS07_02220, partial [Bdellovibrionales bacterium]|nr:hypothetical protein [Bdellovibrionales bacterium]
MIPKNKLEEFRKDRSMFRGAHRVLQDGKLFGDLRDAGQEQRFRQLAERQFKYVLWRFGRGYDKSSGAAWFCVEELVLSVRRIQIILFAADSEQASIMLNEMKGFIDRDPLLATAGFKVMKNEITCRGSSCKVMASDSVGSFGTLADIYVVDEFSSWNTEAHRVLFGSIFTACGKKKDAMLLVLSNAGASFSKVYHEYIERIRSSPDWLVCEESGPAPWLDPKVIEGQRNFLPVPIFLRLFSNQDVAGSGNYFTEEDLVRIVDDSLEPQYKGTSGRDYFLGLDLGLTRDLTSISIVHREGQRLVLDLQKNWKGKPKSPVSIGEVENFILDASQKFEIVQMIYDPFQARYLSERLSGILPCFQFDFTLSNWNLLTTKFCSAVRYGRLKIYKDSTLEGQLLAVEVVQTVNGLKFQNRSGFHDDCVVSL